MNRRDGSLRQLLTGNIVLVAAVALAARFRSQRISVIVGFGITLVSVVLNSFGLVQITQALSDLDEEYRDLRASLDRQNTEMDRAGDKMHYYSLMRQLRGALPPDKQPEARSSAKDILADSLISYYAAANDVPSVDIGKVIAAAYAKAIADLEASRGALGGQMAATGTPPSRDGPPPKAPLTLGNLPIADLKSPLAAKISEVANMADVELTAGTGIEVGLRLLPFVKTLINDWTRSVDEKEARIDEVLAERDRLTRWMHYSTYAALALQIFGLTLVLMQDLDGRAPGAGTPV